MIFAVLKCIALLYRFEVELAQKQLTKAKQTRKEKH